MRCTLALATALAVFPMSVLADTVWLKNGDRLTGEIRVFDGSKLVLKTAYGGSIAIDWKQVATLESDKQLLVKQDDVTGEIAKSLAAGEQPGTVVLENGDQPRTVELSSIAQMLPPKPLVEDLLWTGNLDFGLDFKQGERDTEDYEVDLRAKARHGRWRHTGEAEYNREFQNDIKTTENWSAEYSLDRFFDEHWFWQGRLNYKRDHIEEVREQRTIGTGPGYQFWDNELGAFSLASLVNRSDYKFDTGERDRFYSLGLKWDYNRYLSGKTLELFSYGEVGKPLSGVADFALDAQVGLRYKVTDWASLNVKAQKDMISGADGDLDETRYTIGFGVGW